jgi:hypothetical protein
MMYVLPNKEYMYQEGNNMLKWASQMVTSWPDGVVIIFCVGDSNKTLLQTESIHLSAAACVNI